MAEQSNINSHIGDKHSPLETLAMQALRRFGDFHPGTVDGDVMLMFVEFANMVIDDVRVHPYHDGTEIDYYTSSTDVRKVPDPIIIQGLLNGNTKIQMKVRDGGTNKRNSEGLITNKYNGTVAS